MKDRTGNDYYQIRRKVRREFLTKTGVTIALDVVRAQAVSIGRLNRPAGISGRQWVKLRKATQRAARAAKEST